ncbi:hypothetical protein AB835_11135 [Candidatus Endobugula sertula]|uniref:Pyridine nucleotide-disulfide oxidoreductase n=1 Tax=Candidatus Endobugula sertula TaxID=62101 RepID=A0A1D2QN52_9GAMM|nr:hypothetical protein AB835_11135 [Candidatus Endobugula sertula]
MKTNRYYPIVIIGAGPAGLQLAFFLEKYNIPYVVLEANDTAGSFYNTYPRHRKCISINKVYTGYEDPQTKLRYDWNSLICDDGFSFSEYTTDYFPNADDYVQYLGDYASRYQLNILYKHQVTSIKRTSSGFSICSNNKHSIDCSALVVASGVQSTYMPDIPGIEYTESYSDCSIEPKDFIGKRVLVIGKGNAAFETANHLCGVTRVTHLCSPSPIKMAWTTHFFGHLRAVNNELLDTYILKGQNSILDADINKIEKTEEGLQVTITFSHAEGQQAVMVYDSVIYCTGFRWVELPFDKNSVPERSHNNRLPAMTSAWESTNVKNLYYAGTITQSRDFHKTMSNVIHGFRFNTKVLSHLLLDKYTEENWPYVTLPMNSHAVCNKIIDRVSSSPALMHQPGFLGDLIVVDKRIVKYYEDMSVDHITNSSFSTNAHYYVITMEYGEANGNIFAVDREPDPTKALNDFYLHPRIQRFNHGKQLHQYHMSEHLENDWRVGKHPGKSALIKSLDYIGNDNPEKFDDYNRSLLLDYLEKSLGF